MKSFMLIIPVLLAVNVSLYASTITLRDGTVYEGDIESQNKEAIVIRVRQGASTINVSVATSEIKEISHAKTAKEEKREIFEAERQQLLEDAEFAMKLKRPKDAAVSWNKLGDLYERNHYSAEAKKAFENVLFFEPDHEYAKWKLSGNQSDVRVTQSDSTSVLSSPGSNAFDAAAARMNLIETRSVQSRTVNFEQPVLVRPESYSAQQRYWLSNDEPQRRRYARYNCAPSRTLIIMGVSNSSNQVCQNTSYNQNHPLNSVYPTPDNPTSTPFIPGVTPPYRPPVSTSVPYSRPPANYNRPPMTPVVTVTPGSNNPSPSKPVHGNNGLGNGLDPQPPGNPPLNDGAGARPGSPGNRPTRR